MTSVASIGSMHTTGTSSLETGPASQGATELHHHAANLVTHGGMALVVMNWGSTAVGTGGASGSSSRSRCSSSGCRCTLSVCPAATHQTGLERWAGGSACGAGGAGSVAACERHGCWFGLNRWIE